MLPVTGGVGGVLSSKRGAKCLDLGVVLAPNQIVVA